MDGRLQAMIGRRVWFDSIGSGPEGPWGGNHLVEASSDDDQVRLVLTASDQSRHEVIAARPDITIDADRVECAPPNWWRMLVVQDFWAAELRQTLEHFQGRICELRRQSLVIVDQVVLRQTGAIFDVTDLQWRRAFSLRLEVGGVLIRPPVLINLNEHWLLNARPRRQFKYIQILQQLGWHERIEQINWS